MIFSFNRYDLLDGCDLWDLVAPEALAIGFSEDASDWDREMTR